MGALTCQDCGGAGGEIEVVIPETGQGPWTQCGWCEGTGVVTPKVRGAWLHMKREERALARTRGGGGADD